MYHEIIDKVIKDAIANWDKWGGIVHEELWLEHNKTKEEAIHIREWCEGQYDMAIKIRGLI